MGVRGLQTFLRKNESKFAHKEDISDTHLVIDANSLLCRLYSTSAQEINGPDYRNDIYGGDLVKYGQNVREFFGNLKKCKITAVLVFDGSGVGRHELVGYVGSKSAEAKRRGSEKFKRAEMFNEHPHDEEILLPQNINLVFKSIASELGIKKIQAPYEADTHIARVANQHHCHVLSDDSDFFIYALEKGFILLDYFDFKRPKFEGNEWSIEATIFSQDKLTQSMQDFRLEVMPLLSIILGNDYVDRSVFSRIMENICNGTHDGPFITSSYNHRRIANSLVWLRGKSLDESIEYIIQLVKPEFCKPVKDIITVLLRNYSIDGEDDFDKELESVLPAKRVGAPSDRQMPVQFLRHSLEEKDLGCIVLDIIFHNTHYNYIVLDDFSLKSSTEISFRPLSLALVLLRAKSYDNLTESERRDQSKRDSFTLYDRKDTEYAEFTLEPLATLEGFGSLEHLDCYSMILLDEYTKRQLLMACFRFTTEKQQSITDSVSQLLSGPFIEQASLCFLLIRYIRLESKLVPNAHFVNSLVLTLVYYAIQSEQLNKRSFPSRGACDQLVSRLQPLSVKNDGKTEVNQNQSIYRRIMHYISELQVAYKAYCLVNTLLGHYNHQPKLDLFFNAVLIYRTTLMLHHTEETMESICSELPLIIEICDSLKAQVCDRKN